MYSEMAHVQTTSKHGQTTSARGQAPLLPHISVGYKSDKENKEMKIEAIRQYERLQEDNGMDITPEMSSLESINRDFEINIDIDLRNLDDAVHKFQIGLSMKDRADFKRLLDMYKKYTMAFYDRLQIEIDAKRCQSDVVTDIRSGKKTIRQLVEEKKIEERLCIFNVKNTYSRKKRVEKRDVSDETDQQSFYIGRYYDDHGFQHLPKEIRSLIWPNMKEIDVAIAGPSLAYILGKHFLGTRFDILDYTDLDDYITYQDRYMKDALKDENLDEVALKSRRSDIKNRIVVLMNNCESLDDEPV